MLAIADGKLSIIQYLLKNGADTEITDYRKQKAADWAEERGNHEALSYITKHDQEKRKIYYTFHIIWAIRFFLCFFLYVFAFFPIIFSALLHFFSNFNILLHIFKIFLKALIKP